MRRIFCFLIFLFPSLTLLSQEQKKILLSGFETYLCEAISGENFSREEIENNFNHLDKHNFFCYDSLPSEGFLVSAPSPFVTYKINLSADGRYSIFKEDQYPFIKWDKFESSLKRIVENVSLENPQPVEVSMRITIDLRAFHPCFHQETKSCFVDFGYDSAGGFPEYFVTAFNDTVWSRFDENKDTIIDGKKYKKHFGWDGKLAAIGNFSGKNKKGLWIEFFPGGYWKGIYRKNKIRLEKSSCSVFGFQPGILEKPRIRKKKIIRKGIWIFYGKNGETKTMGGHR